MKLTNFSDFVEQEMLNINMDLEYKDKVIDYIMRVMKNVAERIHNKQKSRMVTVNPSDSDIRAIIQHLNKTNNFSDLLPIENIDELSKLSNDLSNSYGKAKVEPKSTPAVQKTVEDTEIKPEPKKPQEPKKTENKQETKPIEKKPKKKKADNHKAQVESVFGNFRGEEGSLF